jgi:hypothetical protein
MTLVLLITPMFKTFAAKWYILMCKLIKHLSPIMQLMSGGRVSAKLKCPDYPSEGVVREGTDWTS